MAVSNSLSTRPKFSVAIQSEGYKNLINNTLSDPRRAAKFIATITSAVAVNPALQECDPSTILSAGLLPARRGVFLVIRPYIRAILLQCV